VRQYGVACRAATQPDVKKKTRRASEAKPEERAAFGEKQLTLSAAQLWFIDEFGVHLALSRRYARPAW